MAPNALKEAAMYAIRGLLVLTAVLAVPAAGAEDAKTKKSPKRDPKVLELVKQAADLYKSAKTLHVEVDVETNVQNGEEKQEIRTTCTYDLEKPNRLALRTRPGKGNAADFACICDGKKLLVYAASLKQYTESPA